MTIISIPTNDDRIYYVYISFVILLYCLPYLLLYDIIIIRYNLYNIIYDIIIIITYTNYIYIFNV